MLRLPTPHTRSLICFASGPHAVPPLFVLASTALPGGWRTRLGPGSLFSRQSLFPGSLVAWTCMGAPRFPGDPSCTSAPFLDPGRASGPSPMAVPLVLPLLSREQRLQRDMISGLPRGFSTCCLRFMRDVATAHARLASGWLAGLCREGVEPSGSRRKVSKLLPLFPPFLGLS